MQSKPETSTAASAEGPLFESECKPPPTKSLGCGKNDSVSAGNVQADQPSPSHTCKSVRTVGIKDADMSHVDAEPSIIGLA